MKQLIFNGVESSLFFTPQSSIEEIISWVESSILSDEIGFELNEPHSCVVQPISDREILISGDEDLVVVLISDIIPIF